jgi:hypothetical protein
LPLLLALLLLLLALLLALLALLLPLFAPLLLALALWLGIGQGGWSDYRYRAYERRCDQSLENVNFHHSPSPSQPPNPFWFRLTTQT